MKVIEESVLAKRPELTDYLQVLANEMDVFLSTGVRLENQGIANTSILFFNHFVIALSAEVLQAGHRIEGLLGEDRVLTVSLIFLKIGDILFPVGLTDRLHYFLVLLLSLHFFKEDLVAIIERLPCEVLSDPHSFDALLDKRPVATFTLVTILAANDLI